MVSVMTACEYGPMAGAAWSVDTIVRDMMISPCACDVRNRLYCTPLCLVVDSVVRNAETSAGEFK